MFLTLRTTAFSFTEAFPVPCRVFNSISDLCILDARAYLQVVMIKQSLEFLMSQEWEEKGEITLG